MENRVLEELNQSPVASAWKPPPMPIDSLGKSSAVVTPMSAVLAARRRSARSEEHTSELQSLMRISYAVFCLKKTTHSTQTLSSKAVHHTTKIQSPIRRTCSVYRLQQNMLAINQHT